MRAFDDVRSAHWTANLEVTNYSQSRRVVSLYPSMACSWKINLVPSLSCNAVRRFIVTHSNLHIRINWTSTVNIRKFRAFVHSLCNNIIKVPEWFIVYRWLRYYTNKIQFPKNPVLRVLEYREIIEDSHFALIINFISLPFGKNIQSYAVQLDIEFDRGLAYAPVSACIQISSTNFFSRDIHRYWRIANGIQLAARQIPRKTGITQHLNGCTEQSWLPKKRPALL